MKLSDMLKAAGASQEAIDAALKMEADLSTANTESKDRRLEIKNLKEQMSKFEGIDPDKYKEAQDALAKLEEEKNIKAGDFEKIKKTLVENHQKETEKLSTEKEKWRKKYETLSIDNAIITVAAKNRAIKPEDVAQLVRPHIFMDEEGNATIQKEGKPLLNSEGKSITIETYVSSFLESNPHYVQGSGGGGGSTGGNGEPTGEEVRGQGKIAKGLKDRQTK